MAIQISEYMYNVHKLIVDRMERGELNLDSKDALKSILQEYEIHIKLIEQELEKCKKDHVDLQSEITKLVEENRTLARQLKLASEKAMSREVHSFLPEAMENVMQQLSLALDEKNSLEALWKSSVNELEILKEKLKEHESGKVLTKTQNKLNDVQRDYTEVIQILESKILVLKTENDQLTAKNDVLEKQLMQSAVQMADITEKSLSVSNLLKEVAAKEQEWKSRYLLLEAKYLELDKLHQADKVKHARSYESDNVESNLRERLDMALRQRDELQVALERCHENMADLIRSAASDRRRIEEAVSIVEEALQGRDKALAREAVSIEEMKKIKSEMDRLVEVAGQRVGEEVAAVRNQFQQLIKTQKEELQLLKQERDRKSEEAHHWQLECERLQERKGQLKRPPELLQEDKCQISKAYAELQFIEAECHQLQLENEQLHQSLTQLQGRCRKNSREKIKLKRELKRVQEQNQLCQHELAVTVERADMVNRQLQQTNLELTQLQSEAILHRDSVASVQAKVSVANTLELYKCLDESYGQMNDKWKNEMNALTEKFEARLKKVKKKLKTQAVTEHD